MSGRDVVIAALLGAEEFGFATAPLIAMGCSMMRVCQLDTCPFGVATQNEKLRAKFPGKPEYVENFMKFIAQEMREIMAKFKDKQGFKRAGLVDMGRVLANAEGDRSQVPGSRDEWKADRSLFDFKLEKTVDLTKLVPDFEKSSDVSFSGLNRESFIPIQSTDRTVGTILGSEIQKKFGNTLKDDTYCVNFKGGAGQSFGAFIPKGLTLRLTGDANDAFGKGLSGGKLVIKKPESFEGDAASNIIVGNVALFGATSGIAFINGVAGERFCVRNSGATVVAEGCGDHGLEYMTGGTAVILGGTGKNLCAGMSGGIAYVIDENHDLYKRLNHELVKMYALDDETTTLVDQSSDEKLLQSLIEQHVKETGSERGKLILSDWEHYKNCFKKIIPNDYLRIKKEIAVQEQTIKDHEEAVLAAFKRCSA